MPFGHPDADDSISCSQPARPGGPLRRCDRCGQSAHGFEVFARVDPDHAARMEAVFCFACHRIAIREHEGVTDRDRVDRGVHGAFGFHKAEIAFLDGATFEERCGVVG